MSARTAKRVKRSGDVVDTIALHREHRHRVCASFGRRDAWILVHGGSEMSLYDTDTTVNTFQQESNFHYLFGAKEPDCFGAIRMSSRDGSRPRSYLFVPKLPKDYQVWMGPLKSTTWFCETYGVDRVCYVNDMLSVMTEDAKERMDLFVLRGTNTDSGSPVRSVVETKVFKDQKFESHFNVIENKPSLYDAIVSCRLIKSPLEIELMKYVTDVTSDAHMAVLRHCKPGMREYQLESLFKHHCYYFGGCRHVAYTCICASGSNGAVLHYGHAAAPNSRIIRRDDMCLFDMGAEYHRYASDVTCSFPADGSFTADQRAVYETVLEAQWAVMKAMKPGVSWLDMHELAYRIICERLRDVVGVLRKTASVDEMMKANVASLFMSHGLGHFIGLAVHDVGGYTFDAPARPTKSGYKSLRTARRLQAGMTLTVEPGVYFNEYALSSASPTQRAFLVPERIEEFKDFGGVRIEDVVLVTSTGIENLTNCPRTVSDVEAVMSGAINDRRKLKSLFYRKDEEKTSPNVVPIAPDGKSVVAV